MITQNGWTKRIKELEAQIAALTALLGEKEINIANLQKDYEDASSRIVALTAENERLREEMQRQENSLDSEGILCR